MSPDPADVIRRFVADVWNDGRPQTAYDVIGPDLPGLDGIGPEATLAWHADRRTSFPDDGLVVEVSSVNDLFGLLQQLGVEVSPPTT